MDSLKQIIKELKVSKDEKISDKSLTYNLIASFGGMLLCLLLLSATTFAWFKDNVSTSNTVITASSCIINVSVASPDALNPSGFGDSVLLVRDENRNGFVYTADFNKDVTYKITLDSVGDLGGNAYCKIMIGDYVYCSGTMSAGASITFYVTVTDADTLSIDFSSGWGMYSGNSDIAGGFSYSYSAEHGLEIIGLIPNP